MDAGQISDGSIEEEGDVEIPHLDSKEVRNPENEMSSEKSLESHSEDEEETDSEKLKHKIEKDILEKAQLEAAKQSRTVFYFPYIIREISSNWMSTFYNIRKASSELDILIIQINLQT